MGSGGHTDRGSFEITAWEQHRPERSWAVGLRWASGARWAKTSVKLEVRSGIRTCSRLHSTSTGKMVSPLSRSVLLKRPVMYSYRGHLGRRCLT